MLQKQRLLAPLIGLLLILLLANATAYIDLETDSERCYNDGSFSFRAWNSKPDQLYTKDVEIEVWKPSTREMFLPRGVWSEEIVWFTVYNPEQRFTTYTSFPGTLNDSVDYRIRLAYAGCRERNNCVKAITFDNCPGFTTECKGLDTHVTSCYNRGNQAFITFSVPKASYASMLRPYKDLNFHFKSNYQDRDGVDKIPGLIIDQKGNRTFMMTVPLRDGETISQAAVAMKSCDSPATEQKLVLCDKYLPGEVVDEAVKEYVETTPTPPQVVAKAKEERRQEEAAKRAEIEAPTTLPPEPIASSPQPVQKKITSQQNQPVLIIPLHTFIIAIVIIMGAAIIIYSYQASHRKVKDEEE